MVLTEENDNPIIIPPHIVPTDARQQRQPNHNMTTYCVYWQTWKKYSDFGGGKKNKSDSEFLSYNLMLNSGTKCCALRDKRNKYSNYCVVRKKKFWTKQKTITPLQVKWSVPTWKMTIFCYIKTNCLLLKWKLFLFVPMFDIVRLVR
jgi:hypothetical protein